MKNTFHKILTVCASSAACLSAASAVAVTVTVDVTDVKARVSPNIYGTGMEDVNHEIYGGLDAQRIFGESFEESPRDVAGLSGAWRVAAKGKGTKFVHSNALGDIVWGVRTGKGAQRLISESGERIGIANSGLHNRGIAVRKDAAMPGYVWLSGAGGEKFSVTLESADGTRTYARHAFAMTTNAWHRYDFTLRSDTDDSKARFALYLESRGWPIVDDVFLSAPQYGRFAGIGVRCDVAEGLVRAGVNFIRWGGSMANVPEYRLEKMRPGERTPYEGLWYREASGGFGPYQFVELADRMRVPCAFSIGVGEKTDEAVRLATYLKSRPGSYCVQIGNEECIAGDDAAAYRFYAENFLRLEGAMRAANPALRFVSAAWWRKDSPNMDLLFDALEGHCEYQDLHPWTNDPKATLEQRKMVAEFRTYRLKRYPGSKLKAVVFEENGDSHGMGRALGHVLMTEAVREAGDFILTSCQANAFQPDGCNDNGWDQGLVFLTPDKVWLQPQAYANRMAAETHRALLVAGRTDDADVSVSATRDADGRSVVLHLVNVACAVKPLTLALPGYAIVKVTTLSAPTLETDNTAAAPTRVAPRDVTAASRDSLALEPYSYTVVQLEQVVHSADR